MFDSISRDLGKLGRYLDSYLSHYPMRSFFILGAIAIVFVWWLMRK